MGYNKFVIDGVTKIDLTSDTVKQNTLLSGNTAHDKSGEQIVGTIPIQDGSAFTKDEETGNVVMAAGYYPNGMVLWYNEYGEWEWDPFNFETGVIVEPKIVRYSEAQNQVTLTRNTMHYMVGFPAEDMQITLEDYSDTSQTRKYSLVFQVESEVPTIALPSDVHTPDGYLLESWNIYRFDIIENLLTVRNWPITPEEVVLISDLTVTSSDTFTQSLDRSVSSSDSLVMLVDFTFTGSAWSTNSNLIRVGLSPDSWNYNCVGFYINASYSENNFTVQSFADQSSVDTTSLRNTRHRLVFKVNYSGSGNLNVWMDGTKIVSNFGSSPVTGSLSMSNAEGSNRFVGTYHEVKILSSSLSDEELRAASEVT